MYAWISVTRQSALARPYVIKEDGLWRMWFSHKNTDYRIGYAESYDGLSWERLDHLAGIDVSFLASTAEWSSTAR